MKVPAFFLLLLFWLMPALAWDAVGHRLIASIAYDRLNVPVRAKVDALTKVLDPGYSPYQRFLYLAVWPDLLSIEYNIDTYNGWHFIDQPLVFDGVTATPVPTENIVWAIAKAKQVLLDAKASDAKKARFLSFLVHFVGDIHQPLHCVELYNKEYPRGDAGGNFIKIVDVHDVNLHTYWDDGLGLFYRYKQKNLIKKIAHDFPENSLAKEAGNLNVNAWAKESYEMARDFAYQIKSGARPSRAYNRNGRKIVAKRLALAAYRLARLLNKLMNPAAY